jgi:hypothetical protein
VLGTRNPILGLTRKGEEDVKNRTAY